MSIFNLIENKTFKEFYYQATLENGFKIIVIPKKRKASFAMVCCDFGGADIKYERDGEIFTFPSGVAHFLEHKMFETESGGDSFLEFDDFGGNANAFTSFSNTCYYFSCTDNFYENLNILLKSVSGIHCTEKSVEKERKIIAREITMYDDSPSSNVGKNLRKAMYHTHPTIHPISGTLESIEEIDKETLERAYEHFYIPSNMSLCVCGDVDKDEIYKIAQGFFKKPPIKRPKTIFDDEPITVKSERVEEESLVASALYTIGIKCPSYEKNDYTSCRYATAMRLAISLIFGRASDFFCQNYENGLLNERFYAGYTTSCGSAYVVISGSGNEYERVMQKALEEIKLKQEIFFTDEQILREKKAAYAESLTLFDSGEDLVTAMATCAHLDYDEFDSIEMLRDVTAEEIKQALKSIDINNHSISIIRKGLEQ